MPRLILASASPRRLNLMREYGYVVEVVQPPLQEPNDAAHTLPPAQQAEAMSYFKARSVNALFESGWILAGDTIVSLRGQVFGKPVDHRDARRILSTLSGTTHEVITGVTLLDASTGRRAIRHEVTAVTMRTMTEEDLDLYLASDAWQGKAGAYGIQDRGDAFIDSIEGSFTNVVGFPMELVGRLLAAWGLEYPGGSATDRPWAPGVC